MTTPTSNSTAPAGGISVTEVQLTAVAPVTATSPVPSDVAKEVLALVGSSTLTNSNITQVCIGLMQYVEKLDSLTGVDKRQLVLNALNQYVQQNVSNDTVKEISSLINSTLPLFMDSIISVDKGDTLIHAVATCGASCGGCFGGGSTAATTPVATATPGAPTPASK